MLELALLLALLDEIYLLSLIIGMNNFMAKAGW